MKFYEFLNPYYALIKAGTKKEAVEIYIKNVAGEECEFKYLLEECKKVSKEYATIDILEAKVEDFQSLKKEEVLDILKGYKNEVILIDGSLL